jgi:uridine monophosphate synthetase
MNPSFMERLEARVRQADSLLCVGLDPRTATAAEAQAECLHLIEATRDCAAAFKLNSAFFEVFGGEGLDALRRVIASVPPEIPVILDAKRGDIAETSAAYARGAFDTLGAGAVTINPYLGGDALAPFLERPGHGAFVLCKTSNPGADEFQALGTSAGALFQVVARAAQRWNTRNNVGLVVGATDPTRLARVRELAGEMWILVPGIGAQGGSIQAAVTAGVRADGMGILLNASRTIASAPDRRAAAESLRNEINSYRQLSRSGSAMKQPEEALARDLLASGCVRFGEFTLRSGQTSPIYLDLRRLVSHPSVLEQVAEAYAAVLTGIEFDRLAGIPFAALPIATAVALVLRKPLVYPRQAKEYGTRAAIEGEYHAGETVVVLDDLATTGDTKLETIEKLTSAGLVVRDIVVLIDRGQGAAELLARAGYRLHAVTTLPQLLEQWRASNAVTQEQYDRVANFLGQS